jgi:dTDP-glucose pyrophosphorylase
MIKITVKPSISIKEAMNALNKSAQKCLVIVDSEQRLLGTLTDGDIRKAMLTGFVLGDSIENIFNINPITFYAGSYNLEDAKKLFIESGLTLIPILDCDRKVIDQLNLQNIFGNLHKINSTLPLELITIIIAGGIGSRLMPFTKVLPKSLIPIKDKPIIQHIIENIADQGAGSFYISLNYKANIIKAYFEDLDHKYTIRYIEEKKPMGTIGSLSYLVDLIDEPFFVTNSDVIINLEFKKIYEFHIENKFDITLLASPKEYIIPYGDCHLDKEGALLRIVEKPQYNCLVNTGFYVISPRILELIPKNKSFHMTDLIELAKSKGNRIGVYPINDDEWLDVGQWDEYKKTIQKLSLI